MTKNNISHKLTRILNQYDAAHVAYYNGPAITVLGYNLAYIVEFVLKELNDIETRLEAAEKEADHENTN